MSSARAGLLLVAVGLLADSSPSHAEVTSCFGKQRASLGPCFGSLTLGQTDTAKLPASDTLEDDIDISLDMIGSRVDGVEVTISDTTRATPLCPDVRQMLEKRWGPLRDDRWIAPSRAQGVELTMLDPPSCKLRFYRMVPAAKWLNKSEHSVVPVWAIGERAEALDQTLTLFGAGHDPEDRSTHSIAIRWSDRSIDGDQIFLTAYVVQSRVVGIEVELMTDDGLRAWKRIKAMYGAPTTSSEEDGDRRFTWKHSPGVELVNSVPDGTSYMYSQQKHPAHPAAPYAETQTTILFGIKP